MPSAKPLTSRFWVCGQLSEEGFAAAAAAGFQTVINFRPDAEVADQISSNEARRAASAVGMAYVHLPADKTCLFADTLVTETAAVLAMARGPVLAYCTSGQRAAIVWAAASARTQSVDEVLAILDNAGFDFGFLRDDLEAQADRARWDIMPIAAPQLQVPEKQGKAHPRAAARPALAIA